MEGSLDDGYYFINFSNYSDPSTCMVPVQDGDLWRLGAYPRENSEFDNSFIWHVTKNADGKTYSFKIMVDHDMKKVAVERAEEHIKTNLAEYLEKGVIK